jgi:hypothetical protein
MERPCQAPRGLTVFLSHSFLKRRFSAARSAALRSVPRCASAVCVSSHEKLWLFGHLLRLIMRETSLEMDLVRRQQQKTTQWRLALRRLCGRVGGSSPGQRLESAAISSHIGSQERLMHRTLQGRSDLPEADWWITSRDSHRSLGRSHSWDSHPGTIRNVVR